ncbi:MAG: four helix bundle protein [Rhodoferax sp.]|nr:four helix bundle protein [Rhodoferax sp.]MDP3651081.1 four helix bundle protein [Rhodoferax sp.]
MALYSDLPIYKHGCDLLSLALDVQTQLPRMYKRSLGEKIHGKCVDMLEAMAMANASRDIARVEQIDTLLQRLRATTAMLRVSHDKRLISHELWAQSVEVLDAVGSQAGGWRKQTLKNLSAAPAV